jgi:hypothetical protein
MKIKAHGAPNSSSSSPSDFILSSFISFFSFLLSSLQLPCLTMPYVSSSLTLCVHLYIFFYIIICE